MTTARTSPDFADLYAHRGRPAEAPARLALVLVLQHIEQLGDVEAAEAVRARLDWKYALALEIDAPGFDATILGDFRTRLLAAGAEERLLSIMLDTPVDAGLLKACGTSTGNGLPLSIKVFTFISCFTAF